MSEREQKKKRAHSFSKGDPTLHCTFSQWFIPPSHRVTGGRANEVISIKKQKYFISKKNIIFLIIFDGALSSSHSIFLRLQPPFPLRNISCDVHMTCIKVVLIFTINPLPCMFYLSPSLRQSLALFLSLSSGHVRLWGLTATLQMQPC